jgi:hypothetical protein
METVDSDEQPSSSPARPWARHAAAWIGGAQAVILLFVAVAFLIAAVAAGRSRDEFHGLAQFFDVVAAGVVGVTSVGLGAAALTLRRSTTSARLLALGELPVLAMSLWLRTTVGTPGHVVGPVGALLSTAVLACLVLPLSRVASAALVVAVAVALIVLAQPPAPSFAAPPRIDIAAPITFDALSGCRFQVVAAAHAKASPLPCSPAGAAAERRAMSTIFPPGEVHICGQRIGGPPPPRRACIDLGGGILVTAKGPSDYYFWGGVWSPDRRWVAFSDTRDQLLVASADGRGPWRVDGRPARVTAWSGP